MVQHTFLEISGFCYKVATMVWRSWLRLGCLKKTSGWRLAALDTNLVAEKTRFKFYSFNMFTNTERPANNMSFIFPSTLHSNKHPKAIQEACLYTQSALLAVSIYIHIIIMFV